MERVPLRERVANVPKPVAPFLPGASTVSSFTTGGAL